ncbi:MAG TPA: response regulator [Opitutaceae bacterium]|nr:response regulator [Lacunisphaera sp.]HWA10417.1 response regulator [Opitutaceae bacterium]
MPYRRETISDGETKALRVLCAEDDPHIALVLKQGLVEVGHFVECVVDGLDAIERVKAQPAFFDLVITDHNMPRSTGLVLVRALRLMGFAGRIIVHASGLRPADEKAYRQLAVDRLFDKPLQSAELMRVVAALRRVAW